MIYTGPATVVLLALLLVGCVIHSGIGARFIASQMVLRVFLHFDPRNPDHSVIVRLRLPRLAAILLTDTSLGVAGTLLQAVIHNPLGGPHVLGLNTGAVLTVIVANTLGLVFLVGCPLLVPTGGALLFLLILLLSSAGRSELAPMKVIPCGVTLSVFVSSTTTAALILDERTLLTIRIWLAGDLAGQDWTTLGMPTWFSLEGLILAFYLAPSLNMLALGGRMAQGLSVSVFRTRIFTLLTVILLCGAAVSTVNPIDFIGLLVPQTARHLVPTDLRVLLPLSARVDTFLLLLADIIVRALFAPHELVTDVMMTLVGTSVFIIMTTRVFE